MHVPKTAGSTLTAILMLQYSGENTFSFEGNIERDTQRLNSNFHQDNKMIKLFTGHSPVTTKIPMVDAIPIITLLREPVSRVKSYCQYVFELNHTHFNLDEFICSGNGQLENLQTKMLINHGSLSDNSTIRMMSESEIKDKALQSLFEKVYLFGIQEKFDESLILFKEKLGWAKPIFYISQNKKIKTGR